MYNLSSAGHCDSAGISPVTVKVEKKKRNVLQCHPARELTPRLTSIPLPAFGEHICPAVGANQSLYISTVMSDSDADISNTFGDLCMILAAALASSQLLQTPLIFISQNVSVQFIQALLR